MTTRSALHEGRQWGGKAVGREGACLLGSCGPHMSLHHPKVERCLHRLQACGR